MNRNNTILKCIIVIASLFLFACGKEKVKNEKIAFYKSQTRDTAVIGDYFSHSKFEDGKTVFYCYEMKENGEMVNYITDTNFNFIKHISTAYWYTLDLNSGINLYLPFWEDTRDVNEIRARYTTLAYPDITYLKIVDYAGENLYLLERK